MHEKSVSGTKKKSIELMFKTTKVYLVMQKEITNEDGEKMVLCPTCKCKTCNEPLYKVAAGGFSPVHRCLNANCEECKNKTPILPECKHIG